MSQVNFWQGKKERHKKQFLQIGITGSIAGIIEYLVLYPIKTLKTHMFAAEGVNSYL